MPATRVRVRPPHNHKGLMILWALFGVACGVVMALVGGWLGDLLLKGLTQFLGPGWLSVGITVFSAINIAPPLLVGLYMARCCQHKRFAYWAGQICATGYVLTFFVACELLDMGPRIHNWNEFFYALSLSVGAGVLAGLAGLLTSWIYREFVAQLIEQDGTLCTSCAYCIDHAPTERCPECGTPKNTPTKGFGRIYHFAEFLGHSWRRLKYPFILAFLVSLTAYTWHMYPSWRFYAKFGGYHATSPVYGPVTEEATVRVLQATRILSQDAKRRTMIVQLRRRGFLDHGHIHLCVDFLKPRNPSGNASPWIRQVISRITCDLDQRQTNYVLDHEIPQSLIDEMLRALDEFSPPVEPMISTPILVISPDGHFPAATD